jgi:hypothetical protein
VIDVGAGTTPVARRLDDGMLGCHHCRTGAVGSS